MESEARGDKQHDRFIVDAAIFRQFDWNCADRSRDPGHDPAAFVGKGIGGGDVDPGDRLFLNSDCRVVFSAVDVALGLGDFRDRTDRVAYLAGDVSDFLRVRVLSRPRHRALGDRHGFTFHDADFRGANRDIDPR